MELKIQISKQQIEEELERSKPLPIGWRKFKITETTAKEAKAKDSVNYVVRHQDTQIPERYIDHYFNSKPFGQTFILKIFAAINNVTVQELLNKINTTEFTLNFETLKDKEVMGKVVHNVSTDGSGRLFANIEDWASPDKVPF